MKLLEQTRRTWQGTRLRDKVLPSHCQPAGVIYLWRINTSPTTPNSRDSSQEHSRLLRDPAWGWACPAPLTGTLMATVAGLAPSHVCCLCRQQDPRCPCCHPSSLLSAAAPGGQGWTWSTLHSLKPADISQENLFPGEGYARSLTEVWLQPRPWTGSRFTPRDWDLSLHHRAALITSSQRVSGSNTTSAQHTGRQGKEVLCMRPGVPHAPAGQLHI